MNILKNAIRKGDTTTHGGVVLEGLEQMPIFDKPLACMGHMVYCPKCQGTYPIVEGIGAMSMFGQPVAVEGHENRLRCRTDRQSGYVYDGGTG